MIVIASEGSLEVKLPTVWADEKQKEDTGVRKGRKVAKRRVFPMNCGSGGSKSRLAKAAGAEMKNCTLLWREAHFDVKSVKN